MRSLSIATVSFLLLVAPGARAQQIVHEVHCQQTGDGVRDLDIQIASDNSVKISLLGGEIYAALHGLSPNVSHIEINAPAGQCEVDADDPRLVSCYNSVSADAVTFRDFHDKVITTTPKVTAFTFHTIVGASNILYPVTGALHYFAGFHTTGGQIALLDRFPIDNGFRCDIR
jgi:hypothetical protein